MTNENVQKLKIPAIGLIIVGILNILCGLYFLLSAITVAYMGVSYKNFTTDHEKFVFQIGFYGIIVLGVLSLVVAPIIILGALKMMRGASDGAAKLSPILAMIPITSFAFLLGIPFGVYALMLMRRIKSADGLKIEN
jgi:hypothetical protein